MFKVEVIKNLEPFFLVGDVCEVIDIHDDEVCGEIYEIDFNGNMVVRACHEFFQRLDEKGIDKP